MMAPWYWAWALIALGAANMWYVYGFNVGIGIACLVAAPIIAGVGARK
jgi:hypothetical protein